MTEQQATALKNNAYRQQSILRLQEIAAMPPGSSVHVEAYDVENKHVVTAVEIARANRTIENLQKQCSDFELQRLDWE